MSDSVRRRTALEIPWATILKLLIAIALAWVFLQLTQLILVVIVAILLAVTLNPVVTRLQRRGLGRGLATAVVCLVLVGILIGFFWMTWNTLSEQARYLSAHADDI